ncbi:hypothetical protein BC826DRAFT_624662 [Russula brevipes]|nr:hypothetical protein BC826DRAFT_624662 [Russula brevipes]
MPSEKSSHISSFGTVLPAKPTISSFPPPHHPDLSTISESSGSGRPRPRPRPIFSHTGAGATTNASISDPVVSHTPPSADYGSQLTTLAHSDPTVVKGATQMADPEFALDIAERAKTRSRKATKRPTQNAEEIIDITDNEVATTPARRPKQRPKPRLIRRATPVGNNPQLPSDSVTIPVPSSSPQLPPSDPFPASTAVNSTPPRPYPLNDIAVPNSPSQDGPIWRKKRKRAGPLHSPMDDLPDLNCPPTVQVNVTSPRPGPPPRSRDVLGAGYALDIGQSLDSEKDHEGRHEGKGTLKKLKTSNKKTVMEVVITSPRRAGSKRVKASKKGSRSPADNGSDLRNNDRTSLPIPAEPALKAVDDGDAYISPQMSGTDDELRLGPKKQPLTKVKSRKGKQRMREPSSVDNTALSETKPSSEQVAPDEGEWEEPRKDAEGTPTSGGHKSRSHPPEPEIPASLKDPKPSASAQENDPPKPSPARETPAPGKLRYTLSRNDQKTPMRELIRRAASHPHASFSTHSSPIASPLAKTTKSALRRIAPLHPTRRTPPPPPPRPPPPKKSKKMLQLEEKWEMEMELEDEVEGWWALTDEERHDWRRAKRDKELGFDD